MTFFLRRWNVFHIRSSPVRRRANEIHFVTIALWQSDSKILALPAMSASNPVQLRARFRKSWLFSLSCSLYNTMLPYLTPTQPSGPLPLLPGTRSKNAGAPTYGWIFGRVRTAAVDVQAIFVTSPDRRCCQSRLAQKVLVLPKHHHHQSFWFTGLLPRPCADTAANISQQATRIASGHVRL